MMTIHELGWNPHFEEQYRQFEGQGLEVGRILKEVRHQYAIHTEDGILDGDVSGHFHYIAENRSDYPTVGDWVLFRPCGDFALIEHVLARSSAFSRKRAGPVTEEQVVAANIDCLCIVCGLDGGRNFNLRGLERYIAMTIESGAKPVIVLNKADLCDDREIAVLQAQSVAENYPIHLVSAATGEGVDEFSSSFEAGVTVALAGPSGVGKSSLINALLGTESLKTGELRASDLKGKHTTTHKELFFLKNGAMVIDTPGMRELQLWGSPDSLDDTYGEIHEASRRCRFADCSHENEPGCAVRELLVDGSLEVERYENYLDMRAELRFRESKVSERKAQAKTLSKLIRRSKNHKNRNR